MIYRCTQLCDYLNTIENLPKIPFMHLFTINSWFKYQYLLSGVCVCLLCVSVPWRRLTLPWFQRLITDWSSTPRLSRWAHVMIQISWCRTGFWTRVLECEHGESRISECHTLITSQDHHQIILMSQSDRITQLI